ncbi:glycosyltransferase [Sulfitobacter pseudonitzschiae]|uniref:glycosyltransferase n=2 Tax=Pseudosulfitobacter pseudonitzschiae TaxID=1402135 RepID=UPI001AFBEC13|nr:glycosyltransferase [Pseudosulfitobacter pseudonitzschiae]MBM1817398.1 glycosyltransferase [Pseudosulfitobacter pseudonitzschiae]MBM1834596.1 glycosyltransferase [Pseudosulfitobacter pseudonitzschiae]MBM1839460.1 glycosyltransferase [Pseudosulfitobacter pseudonitzschiae]MBM1849145.1 glycosyltransferase [Pseudosulfitobacter pseudonitzschiae]MBM1854006.1 glycosyltransferase [Pseudosulfitobacter pseudonitzschiae]
MNTMQLRPTIHWVSPLPPAHTDIAHYTARIMPELSAVAEVILWTDAHEWDVSLERFCTIRHFDPDTALPRDFTQARRGSGPEILFIHIGNSWVFHAGLMRLAQRIPSIVVLHDLAIQELMIEAVKHVEWDAGSYLSGMTKWYGAEGLKIGQACLDGREKGAAMSGRMPGFELALEKARAVLTHTDIACDSIKARLPNLPCYLLPLPFEVGPPPPLRRVSQGPLRLLQFGWIGPNRRLEQVLEALAKMPEGFDFRLDVMGEIWNTGLIHEKLSDLGLNERVHLHGFVPESVLENALRQAHLVLNLRHPSMGEASGSQLRIWNSGAASVVTREGWYAGLPDDVVYSVDLEREREQLHELFRSFAADYSFGRNVAAAGRTYFETHHAPRPYAQGIIKLVEDTVSRAPHLLALRSKTELESNRSLTMMQLERFKNLT